MSYFFRPGDLVTSSNYRIVEGVNLTTKTLTLNSNVLATWTTGKKYDVHSAESGAEIKLWSASVTTASAKTLIFTDAIDGSREGTAAVEVGDYVTLENEAAIPALPRELHPALAQAAARTSGPARSPPSCQRATR